MVDALSIDGSGGSVGRAVAHYSDSNVTVQTEARIGDDSLEPLVRLSFLGLRNAPSNSYLWFYSLRENLPY